MHSPFPLSISPYLCQAASRTTAAHPHRTLLSVGPARGQNRRAAIPERVLLEAGTLDFCKDHIMQLPNIAPVVRHRWPFFS
jgi:hypothetical protein